MTALYPALAFRVTTSLASMRSKTVGLPCIWIGMGAIDEARAPLRFLPELPDSDRVSVWPDLDVDWHLIGWEPGHIPASLPHCSWYGGRSCQRMVCFQQ